MQENARKRNGRFVPDARDHFDFGTSLTLPTTSLVARLRTHITALSSYHPLIPLCHDPRSDLVALQLLGIETSGFKRGMEDLWRSMITEGGLWPNGVWVVDTQVLYSGWMNDKRQVKLETCCAVLQLPTRRLHNAGAPFALLYRVLVKLTRSESRKRCGLYSRAPLRAHGSQ